MTDRVPAALLFVKACSEQGCKVLRPTTIGLFGVIVAGGIIAVTGPVAGVITI